MGLARGVTQLGGSFVMVGSPSQPGQLGLGKTIGTCMSAVCSGNGVNFFIIKIINAVKKLTMAGRVTFFPRTGFLHINGVSGPFFNAPLAFL